MQNSRNRKGTGQGKYADNLQQTERMTLHILGRVGVKFMQPEVFDADSGRPQPGVHFDGVAMRKNRRISCGKRLRGFKRIHPEYEYAADGDWGVVKRSGGHKNAVAPHLLNVRHVGGLQPFTLGLRKFFARRIRTQKDYVITSRGSLRVYRDRDRKNRQQGASHTAFITPGS